MSTQRRRAVAADNWGKPDRNDAGEPICRWCRGTVRPPRRTFCGDACVHEWKVRSDPSYVRDHVWKRDGGVCRLCRHDVRRAERLWRRMKPPAADRGARRAWREARPRWEADHIVAVADGGGECGLENYRLLCRTCHVSITRRWRRSRPAPRTE
ncbi:MAG TPA: HNH endonuclease [Vicinamibacterales bacterium]|nr:HNH endonuclease [Vicinamibacterales bacterium]